MKPKKIILTDATCGTACWRADEEICRCSCGGKYHGCMKSKKGIKPPRTAKINKTLYTLINVGKYNELDKLAREINKQIKENKPFFFPYDKTKILAIVKKATVQQIKSWQELQEYKKMLDTGVNMYYNMPYLLWRKNK